MTLLSMAYRGYSPLKRPLVASRWRLDGVEPVLHRATPSRHRVPASVSYDMTGQPNTFMGFSCDFELANPKFGEPLHQCKNLISV
jgi:hypothetical protein